MKKDMYCTCVYCKSIITESILFSDFNGIMAFKYSDQNIEQLSESTVAELPSRI